MYTPLCGSAEDLLLNLAREEEGEAGEGKGGRGDVSPEGRPVAELGRGGGLRGME